MAKKIAILLVLLVLVYGFFIEPSKIKITHYKIQNSLLKGVKLAFISDLHVKPNDYARLKRIVNALRTQDADIILSTGGYAGGDAQNSSMPIEKVAEILSTANTRNRFYTTLSKEDIASDKERVLRAFGKSSIVALSNTNRRVNVKGKPIFLVGIEGTPSKQELDRYLNNTSGAVILLTHSPNVFSEVSDKVALTLAGHTHGGQVNIPPFAPLFIPSDVNKKYVYGLVEDGRKKMIVTSGLGTSKIPFRLNCPPEIVIVNFE